MKKVLCFQLELYQFVFPTTGSCPIGLADESPFVSTVLTVVCAYRPLFKSPLQQTKLIDLLQSLGAKQLFQASDGLFGSSLNPLQICDISVKVLTAEQTQLSSHAFAHVPCRTSIVTIQYAACFCSCHPVSKGRCHDFGRCCSS